MTLLLVTFFIRKISNFTSRKITKSVYFESQYMMRNNVQAAITAARMSVSLERFLLIEPVGKKEHQD